MFWRNSFSPERDIPSLAGKVILVTGGNAGIGKETVLQLAKHSPKKIFLAARSEARAKQAIDSIQKQTANVTEIEFLPLDLASLASVNSAAAVVNQRTERLDLMFLNAGVMNLPQGKTQDGFDIQLGTNHVGHFLLVKLLLEKLRETASQPSADVRVIVTSSNGYTFAPPPETMMNTNDLVSKGNWTSYGASKAANILFASELARRYPEITAVSLHPGMIKTDLYATTTSNNLFLRLFLGSVGQLLYHDVSYGALTQLWLSTATKSTIKNGAFYTPVGKLEPDNKYSADIALGTALWEWTEDELRQCGY